MAGTPLTSRSTVGVARGNDLYAMTHEALERIGGISTVVQPGESVFIKHNFLTGGLARDNHVLTGEIAKPEVSLAAAEACLLAGAREVIIGDGTQVASFDWTDLRTVDGTTHIVAEVARLNRQYDDRLRLAQLNAESPAWDPLPSPRTALNEIYVSSLVARADRIISVAVLKTHRWANVSLSMKNFMGVPPIERYGGGSERIGRFRLHYVEGSLEGAFLDMVAGLRPDLALIDASIGAEGYAPWVRPGEGRTVDLRERLGTWAVLASTDLVAADATAARMINHEVDRVPHIQRAHEQGLGQAQRDHIDLVGATLNELRMEWEPAIV